MLDTQVLPELNSTALTDMMRFTATDAVDVGAHLAKLVPSPKLGFQVQHPNEFFRGAARRMRLTQLRTSS